MELKQGKPGSIEMNCTEMTCFEVFECPVHLERSLKVDDEGALVLAVYVTQVDTSKLLDHVILVHGNYEAEHILTKQTER